MSRCELAGAARCAERRTNGERSRSALFERAFTSAMARGVERLFGWIELVRDDPFPRAPFMRHMARGHYASARCDHLFERLSRKLVDLERAREAYELVRADARELVADVHAWGEIAERSYCDALRARYTLEPSSVLYDELKALGIDSLARFYVLGKEVAP